MGNNEEKVDITDILQFIRIGIQQLGIQISTLSNLMIKKGLITEKEFEEESKVVLSEIANYIKDMEEKEATEEDN